MPNRHRPSRQEKTRRFGSYILGFPALIDKPISCPDSVLLGHSLMTWAASPYADATVELYRVAEAVSHYAHVPLSGRLRVRYTC